MRSTCRRCPGGPGGLPVQMVISSTNGFQSVYEQMLKLKDAARKSGLFIVSDSDLDFNQPVVRVKIDRSKASDLGITMQNDRRYAGDAARRKLRQPLQPRGTILSGHSAGAARPAAVARRARADITCRPSTGQQVPLSTVVSIETAPTRTR